MKFELDKPLALNRLYGVNKWGSKYIKPAGKEWKENVMWKLKSIKPQNWDVPIWMKVDLYTSKHQDVDSVLKILLDTLQEAGVYKDDYYIYDLRVIKHRVAHEFERVEVECDVIK